MQPAQSRRDFFRVSLALAALPLLAACGPSSMGSAGPATTRLTEARPTARPTSAPAAARPAEAKPAAVPAQAAPATPVAARPTGTLKILLWQAPTILNPHLSTGTKDYLAARCCTEPLITIGGDGEITPVLAAEVPSRANGGVAPDGRSVTYTLKSGVTWADGRPFSADDVAFTFEFVATKESSAVTWGTYQNIEKVEAFDPRTVKITFKEPTGGWFVPFAGYGGQILPKHLMKEFVGARSREAPLNTKLVGTGPYMVEEFRPGDLVVYAANPHYREPGKPAFARLELKGGGDAVSAARAVFQTGEYDYAWNLQVEAAVLRDIMDGGKGEFVSAPGSGTEQLFFNFANHTEEVEGERGAPGTSHPFLTDIKVREAMTLAVDRQTIVEQLYGDGLLGMGTPNILNMPTNLQSKSTTAEFSLDKANKILDDAGYKRGGDGIRVTRTGVRMKVLFQTSINTLRQKEQAIIKDGWQKIGIETEVKSVDQSVFFASDPSNPDTYSHFSADVQMFSSSSDSPFPVGYMNRYYTGPDPTRTWSQKANNYAGRNFLKWKSDEYDKLFDRVLVELEPEASTQTWQQLNNLIVNNFAAVPLVARLFASGKTKELTGPAPRTFDAETWNIADWKKG